MKQECNLCGFITKNDELFEERKVRHEDFHKLTKIKRNTVIGVVEWI